jgi:hypothetical protein
MRHHPALQVRLDLAYRALEDGVPRAALGDRRRATRVTFYSMIDLDAHDGVQSLGLGQPLQHRQR